MKEVEVIIEPVEQGESAFKPSIKVTKLTNAASRPRLNDDLCNLSDSFNNFEN